MSIYKLITETSFAFASIVVATFGLFAAAASTVAAIFSYKLSREQAHIANLPSASVQLITGLMADSGNFPVMFKNHGARSVSIRCVVRVSWDGGRSWNKGIKVYGDAARVDLQPEGSLQGVFVWDDNFPWMSWADQYVAIQAGHELWFCIEAEAFAISISGTYIQVPAQYCTLSRWGNELYMQPQFLMLSENVTQSVMSGRS